MTESDLITTWRQHLAAASAGLHLADASHPLQIFIGRTDLAAPRMVIRTSTKPVKPVLSNLVVVERYEDQSGKWNISFTLQDLKFSEVFLRLVDDLHARSAKAANEQVALDHVNVVIDEWRRLLKPRPAGLLSMDELRGLIGELWLLLGECSKQRAIGTALEGWLGPLGLPQDFWYPDDGYHEAKSIGPATTRIKISSELQLDAQDLELLVLLVGNTDEQTVGAVNLPLLANRVLGALADAAESPDPLNDRLQRLGVDLSEAFYQDTWFVVTRVTSYAVEPGFPAIRASELPEGITRVAYQVELAAVEDFKRYSTEVN
jgi:hypothetical protein